MIDSRLGWTASGPENLADTVRRRKTRKETDGEDPSDRDQVSTLSPESRGQEGADNKYRFEDEKLQLIREELHYLRLMKGGTTPLPVPNISFLVETKYKVPKKFLLREGLTPHPTGFRVGRFS